jgi:hypothetical protein
MFGGIEHLMALVFGEIPGQWHIVSHHLKVAANLFATNRVAV